jgi:hypothetical protein
VQVARPLAPEEIERMRAQIEEEVRAEMTAAAGNQELDQAQLDQVGPGRGGGWRDKGEGVEQLEGCVSCCCCWWWWWWWWWW